MPHLLRRVAPRLALAVGEEAVRRVLVDNPARAFAADWLTAGHTPQDTTSPTGDPTMPFVRIDAFGTDADRLDALGRAVHDALVETLGIPANDRFQVLTGHDGARTTLRWDDYLGVHRDEGIVFVAITLRSGGRPSGSGRCTGGSPSWPRRTPPPSPATSSSP